MGETQLFHRFGGHAHAVGFSLPSARLPLLRERMTAYAGGRFDAAMLMPQVEYDAEIGMEDLTVEFAGWLARCAPFGVENAEPVFLTRGVRLAGAVRRIKDAHIALRLCVGQRVAGKNGGSAVIPAMGWSRGTTDWAQVCAGFGLGEGSEVDVLYRVRRNTGPFASEYMDGLELELRGLRPARG